MSMNFPNSPTVGQIFSPPGAPPYVWDGTVWMSTTASQQRLLISDTPPPTPVHGDLWWESDSGNLFTYYNDGDSSQWVQTNVPSLNYGSMSSPFKRTVFLGGINTTSFQFDPTTQTADIEVQGAGGGGGTTTGSSGAGTCATASGGGAGGYTKKLITVTSAIRAATKTIITGATTAAATVGADSSYTDGTNTLTGSGGGAGAGTGFTPVCVTQVGGSGNTGTGGDINVQGDHGGAGQAWGATYTTTNVAMGFSGAGGSSPFGAGGRGAALSATTSSATINGIASASYGAGGGGGMAYNAAPSNAVGGTGGGGMIVITEYR